MCIDDEKVKRVFTIADEVLHLLEHSKGVANLSSVEAHCMTKGKDQVEITEAVSLLIRMGFIEHHQ